MFFEEFAKLLSRVEFLAPFFSCFSLLIIRRCPPGVTGTACSYFRAV
jgi:hypothetical protein